MTKPPAPVTNSVITMLPRAARSQGEIHQQRQQRARSDREVIERHRFIRIVTAVLIADKNHAARNAELGENGRIVAGATRHLEWTLEQAHEPRSQPAVHHRWRRVTGRAEIDVDAIGRTYARGRGARLGCDRIHSCIRETPQVEHKMRFTRDLARPVQGRVRVEFTRGENEIRPRLLLSQPGGLHVVEKRDGGRDRIVPVATVNRPRVRILPEAARIAEALAAADPTYDGGGQSFSDQRRPLLDVQLEVRADAGWIEEPPPLPNRLRIETLLPHRCLETPAVVGPRSRETARIEKAECAGAPEVWHIEPCRLLRPDRHHG